ncbi:unnamed protein product [Acanthosepion pharaonis]|uniref:Uncharacterized protein n=1 Tax=Acanthosepion pharaonis TaxID=158019 RepID=A0A812BSX0_ACAPH|nr:unnamed protein product [Sepia pharaonis]
MRLGEAVVFRSLCSLSQQTVKPLSNGFLSSLPLTVKDPFTGIFITSLSLHYYLILSLFHLLVVFYFSQLLLKLRERYFLPILSVTLLLSIIGTLRGKAQDLLTGDIAFVLLLDTSLYRRLSAVSPPSQSLCRSVSAFFFMPTPCARSVVEHEMLGSAHDLQTTSQSSSYKCLNMGGPSFLLGILRGPTPPFDQTVSFLLCVSASHHHCTRSVASPLSCLNFPLGSLLLGHQTRPLSARRGLAQRQNSSVLPEFPPGLSSPWSPNPSPKR